MAELFFQNGNGAARDRPATQSRLRARSRSACRSRPPLVSAIPWGRRVTGCEWLALILFAVAMLALFACLVLGTRLDERARYGERMRRERNELASKITTYRRAYYARAGDD